MKFLLIDDELSSLKSISRPIQRMKHQCKMYQDPQKGIEAMDEEAFDVVVTDIKMPELNGLEILRHVKKKYPGSYVIIITGYAEVDNTIEAVNIGVSAIFRKPIDLKSFLERINSIEKEISRKKKQTEYFRELKMEHEQLKKAVNNLNIFLNNEPSN